MKKNYIIPIFIPHLGCPNDCIFCNQKKIAKDYDAQKEENIKNDIESKKIYKDMYEVLSKDSKKVTTEKLENLEKTFKIKEYYAALPDGADKVANIDEFYATLKDNAKNDPEFDLNEFLNEITLLSEADAITNEAISVMSIHASKGLEFDAVFVVDLAQNRFPNTKLMLTGGNIEEERRLFYVAVTRARNELTLSFAKFDKIRKITYEASVFLKEAGLVK